MQSVKASDLEQTSVSAMLNTEGEFSVVKHETLYCYKIDHLYDDEERPDFVKNDLIIRVDSEYSFYDPGLWCELAKGYPSDTYLFVFEHVVRDGLKVNKTVEGGTAKYMTKQEFEEFVEREIRTGKMFATKTAICSRKQNPALWDALMPTQ